MATLEAATLKAFRAGSMEALAVVVETYQTKLFRIGLRLFGQTSDAADFAQDGFVRAFEQRRHYQAERPFEPWLVTVAVNAGRSRLRRRKELPSASLPDPGVEPQAERLLLAQEQREQVQTALVRLQPIHRECLVLRFEAELPLNEIARTLRLSLGTVKSRLNRGLKAFAEAYSVIGGEPHALPRLRSLVD